MRAWLLSLVVLIAACGGGNSGGAGGSGGNGGAGNGSGGISGGSTAPKPIGGSCTGAPDSAKNCQSMLCLGLADNAQKQGGICSKSCQEDVDCGGVGFVCVDLANDGTGYCVRTCQTSDECPGFACLSLDDPTDPISICFVEAASGGTGGAAGTGGATGSGGATGTGGATGAGADCASKGCEIYTDADMITGYCAMKLSTKKLCDCPTLDVPTTCTPTNPAAANLYCCP